MFFLSFLLVWGGADDAFEAVARRDHGPGTSGGGASVQSAQTLAPGQFAFDFRFDYTQFERLTSQQITDRAMRVDSFDLLDRSFLYTFAAAAGLLEDLQVGLSVGYYEAVNAREAEFDAGTGDTEIHTFNPDGITDLWLSGKYRLVKGPAGHVAVFFGVKFPTGRTGVLNSNGEPVEPSATAGSGSYDAMVGAAYSRFLTEQITVDASAQYTIRTREDGFKLGNRLDVGIAIAFRFTENVSTFPQFSVFAEALARRLEMSEKLGIADPNTGGTVLFLAPGARIALSRFLALTLSAQFPALQDLNGTQLETDFRIIVAVSVSS